MANKLHKDDEYVYSCKAPVLIKTPNSQRMTLGAIILTFCSMMSCLFIFYQVSVNKVMGNAHPSKHLALLAIFEFFAIWHSAVW